MDIKHLGFTGTRKGMTEVQKSMIKAELIAHYTIDGHRLCPHPGMTDEDLDHYEVTFSVPRPSPILLEYQRKARIIRWLWAAFFIIIAAYIAAVIFIPIILRRT